MYHVVAAIKSNGADRIRPGDVIVLICQGPIGAGMPDDTRLWAALQRASGGTWSGCVYDVDVIAASL